MSYLSSYLSIEKIAIAAGIIAGFSTWRKSDPLYLKLLPFLLIAALVTQEMFVILRGQNNVIYGNLFSVLFFPFFTYFFKEVLHNNSIKKVLNIVIIVLPILMLLNLFLLQGTRAFNTYSFLAGTFLIITLGMMYFYQLISGPPQDDLSRSPAFWITIALTSYFIATFAVHNLPNLISTVGRKGLNTYAIILRGVNTVFYTLLTISFLCRIPHRKSS